MRIANQQRREHRKAQPEAVEGRARTIPQLGTVDGVVAHQRGRNRDGDHRRREQREVAGHLRDHQHDGERRMRDPSEQRHHADDHERGRLVRHVRQNPVARAATATRRASRRPPCRARRCLRIRRTRSTATWRRSWRAAGRGRPTAAVRAACRSASPAAPSRSPCAALRASRFRSDRRRGRRVPASSTRAGCRWWNISVTP